MVYYQLDQSWEAEMKAGNLLSALELLKTQLSTNIVRFLNQFREKPYDEVIELFRILYHGIPFEDEIQNIVDPFFGFQEEFNDITCLEDELPEQVYVEHSAHKETSLTDLPSDKSPLYKILEEYSKLEKKVAVSIAQFNEADTVHQLEDTIPNIIDKVAATMDRLNQYIDRGEVVQLIMLYCKAFGESFKLDLSSDYSDFCSIQNDLESQLSDPISELQKLASIISYLVYPERAKKYQTPEKIEKLQLYRKYAIWMIQVLMVSEGKMEETFSTSYVFHRENVTEEKDIMAVLRNYSLLELLAEARETIQELREIQ